MLHTKKVGKGISVDFSHVLAVSNFLRGPQGPQRVPKDLLWSQKEDPVLVNILNEIFHYGMISLWENPKEAGKRNI